MSLKWTLAAVAIAAGGIANAVVISRPSTDVVDLNVLQASPLEILEGLVPDSRDRRDDRLGRDRDEQDRRDSRRDSSRPGTDWGRGTTDPRRTMPGDPTNPRRSMPQSCTDAGITEDQRTKIKDAVYQAQREKVQLDASLKLAFMSYGHTVRDEKSDMATAQVAGTQVTDSLGKLATAHMNLATHILYEIVKPEQRAKTFDCIQELYKMRRHKRP